MANWEEYKEQAQKLLSAIDRRFNADQILSNKDTLLVNIRARILYLESLWEKKQMRLRPVSDYVRSNLLNDILSTLFRNTSAMSEEVFGDVSISLSQYLEILDLQCQYFDVE